MKNIFDDSDCLNKKNLEASSPDSHEDRHQEKIDVHISMENNLVNHEEEREKSAVVVNCEIMEEQQELAEPADSSHNINTDESDEETHLIRKGRKAKIINSEDENFEDNSRSNKENIQEQCHNKETTSKSKAVKKKSKNQIKNEKLKIHSETHRLMREREIPIPYHLPKQRTLREFLSRNKNRANIPLNTPSFKMVEIWKDIEESTKTASEFFKSDSDSDCEFNTKDIKSKEYEEKSLERENDLAACGSTGNKKNTDEIEDNVDCNSSSDKQDNCKISDNAENSVAFDELLAVGQNNIEKECDEKNEAFDTQKENAEVLPCKIVIDTINEQSNSAGSFENSNECTSTEILQNINNSNSDENFMKMNTLEWVKNIPVCDKLLKPNKKEMLLKKINPTLLKITPKLSGEFDSVIDLESVTNDIEIGAKKLKNRFFKNCLPSRRNLKNEVELTITVTENDELGRISNVTTEKLIYNSTDDLGSIKCEKPGAKLQRLREELQKKIEEKWEEGYRKQVMEEEVKGCVKERETIENEEDLEDIDENESFEVEGESDDDSDDEDEDEDDDNHDDLDADDKPKGKRKKNMFIDNEAEESGCEESGNEGSDEIDEIDEEEEENEDDNGSKSYSDHVRATVTEKSVVQKNITSLPTEEIIDKDSSSLNAYDTQSSQIPPYQPGGGMLNGGSELSQCDDDNSIPKSILSPTLKLSMYFSPDKKNTASQQSWDLDLELPEVNRNKTSFIPRFPENENFDLNEAYEFCSGKFPDAAEQSQGVTVDSQGSVTSESNEFGFNSGVIGASNSFPLGYNDSKKNEEVNQERKKLLSRIKEISDDSEEESEIQDTNVNEIEDIEKRTSTDHSDNDSEKSFILKNKIKRKHLRFSDEEGNSESEQEKDRPGSEDELHEEDNIEMRDDFSESEVEPFEEDPIRKVEYNSDEEEIVNPKEFFEKEAELSESEWSGDEDERDLDKMEEEVGDGDKFDNRKVRSQLEKIHMRTLLDDDARQVRILQELLFEDGDLFDGGPKREKNFRWKDLGTFFNEEGNCGDDNVTHDQEQLEDEQSAKQRHEKELFLLHLKSQKEELGLEEDENETISLLKVGKIVLQRSMRSSKVHGEKAVQKNNGDIDNTSFKPPVALSKKRGSFLLRNEEFLSRLAKFTSNASDNILGPKHSKNFVFAAKSPEKTSDSSKENFHSKRKGLSPEGDNQTKKKVKLHKEVPQQEPSLLDRLV